MSYKIKIFACCLISILLFTTCKKYPEGPAFTLLTVNHRLFGTYILDKYIVEGIDSTLLLPPCTAVNSVPYSKGDGSYCFQIERGGDIKGLDGHGGVVLVHNKNDIGIDYNVILGSKNLLQPLKNAGGVWEIRKLTNKEFWIKQDYGGRVWEIHLKKLHKL